MQGAVDVAAQVIKHARGPGATGHHSVECASDRQNSVVKLKNDRVLYVPDSAREVLLYQSNAMLSGCIVQNIVTIPRCMTSW
jgi:hypothetical protein